jgi:hypothetical protein
MATQLKSFLPLKSEAIRDKGSKKVNIRVTLSMNDLSSTFIQNQSESVAYGIHFCEPLKFQNDLQHPNKPFVDS